MKIVLAFILCFAATVAFAQTKTCKAKFGFSEYGAEVDDAFMEMKVFDARRTFVVNGRWIETNRNSEIVYFLAYDFGKGVSLSQTKKDYMANRSSYILCLDAQTCSPCR